jgi:hypothetical protein
MKEFATAARVLAGVMTSGTSELIYAGFAEAAGKPFGEPGITGVASIATKGSAFLKELNPTLGVVSITAEEEDRAANAESEAEARRRRRGMLRRTYTTPGQNFVTESNIGRNTLMGA